MRKILFILLFLTGCTSFVYAKELPVNNAGFIPENIWYSKEPFYDGETVRIYTIIFNGSVYDISGSVEFFDNGNIIDETNFSLASGGRVQDVWVNWKATLGTHTITAQITNVSADGPSGKQAVVLDNVSTGKSERIVEPDPVIVATRRGEQVQKIVDVSNQVSEKIENAVTMANESVPEPIREGVSVGVGALEHFRAEQASQFQFAKENKLSEIKKFDTSTTTNAFVSKKIAKSSDALPLVAQKPFAYVMLAILALLQYFFMWRVLFYGIILYALYRLIKWIIHRFTNK